MNFFFQDFVFIYIYTYMYIYMIHIQIILSSFSFLFLVGSFWIQKDCVCWNNCIMNGCRENCATCKKIFSFRCEAHIYICIYIYIYMCVCVCVYICKYTYACNFFFLHICIYMYIHVNIHTHIIIFSFSSLDPKICVNVFASWMVAGRTTRLGRKIQIRGFWVWTNHRRRLNFSKVSTTVFVYSTFDIEQTFENFYVGGNDIGIGCHRQIRILNIPTVSEFTVCKVNGSDFWEFLDRRRWHQSRTDFFKSQLYSFRILGGDGIGTVEQRTT